MLAEASATDRLHFLTMFHVNMCWQGPKVSKEYRDGVSTSLTSTESQRAKECDAEQPATKEACCKRVPLFTHYCYNCRGTSLLQGTIFDRVQIVKENRN